MENDVLKVTYARPDKLTIQDAKEQYTYFVKLADDTGVVICAGHGFLTSLIIPVINGQSRLFISTADRIAGISVMERREPCDVLRFIMEHLQWYDYKLPNNTFYENRFSSEHMRSVCKRISVDHGGILQRAVYGDEFALEAIELLRPYI